MRVRITKYEKCYEFNMEKVTQMCGNNIVLKNYILTSLKKYFSTYKYPEGKNPWRDNVNIDNEMVGRKYFKLINITNRMDLINMINMTKTSLSVQYLKLFLQEFDSQKSLERIAVEIDSIFKEINEELCKIGNLQMVYSESELWDIVQQSKMVDMEGFEFIDTSEFELFNIFIGLFERIMSISPDNYLIIFENADHFLSPIEYEEIVNKMIKISNKYNIHFITSLSLDGYVVVNDELIETICVINELIFEMPNLEDWIHYLSDNYPVNKIWEKEELYKVLKLIVHKLGKNNSLVSIEENVLCKMINKTMYIDECLENKQNSLLEAFLNG